MGDCGTYNGGANARVHRFISNIAAVHGLFVPCDVLQYLRHFMSSLLKRSDPNTVQTLFGIRIFAAQTVLSPAMVHGIAGRHIDHHHHNDCVGALCEKQKLQIQT